MVEINKKEWNINSNFGPSDLNRIEDIFQILQNEINGKMDIATVITPPKYELPVEEVQNLIDQSLEWHNVVGTAHNISFGNKVNKTDFEDLVKLVNTQQKTITKLQKEIKQLKESMKDGSQ